MPQVAVKKILEDYSFFLFVTYDVFLVFWQKSENFNAFPERGHLTKTHKDL